MKQVRWLLLVLLILGLCACGSGNTGANSNTNPDASQEFLNERSGTATADGTATTGGGTTGMTQNPISIGIVQQVQGSTIMLLDPMTKQAKSVELAANAKITTQGNIQLSEIQTGDKITAMGQQNGDQFQAEAVQVGEGGAMGGGPVMIGSPNTTGPGNELEGGPPAPGAQVTLSGTVESVQGQQFVVKTADGKSVTVQLVNGAQVRKQLSITPEQIEVGKLIVANGTLNGSTFEASSVEVLAAPPAP